MSDQTPHTDPVDQAYVEAEALINDDAARAARRARVLAAVAQTEASPGSNASHPAPRTAWRRGGWLTAASLAGFGLFWAADQSIQRQAPTELKTGAAPTEGTPVVGAPPAPPTASSAPSSTRRASPAHHLAMHPPPPIQSRPAPPPADIPPPALPIPPVRMPQPEAMGPPAPIPPSPPAPPAPPASPAPPLAAWRTAGLAGMRPGPAERLRSAARDGRIADIEALLSQDPPLDAPDADGDTALMLAVKADQPAAAALLRAHGASLDQKNHAGVSARDMAKAIDDPDLDRALGLSR